MKIYVTHAGALDYQHELYLPIRESSLSREHEFILPHEKDSKPFDSRPLIFGGGIDLVIAEVSLPSTAQGIELGWANACNIPIYFFYRVNTAPSKSLAKVSGVFMAYANSAELITAIAKAIADA